MRNNRNRYRQMEFYMTCTLAADTLLFLFYLISAGNGIIWLKAITAILAIGISLLCLGFLYLSQELLRTRSLWMSAAAAAILLCTVFSLLLNYPSPNPYNDSDFSVGNEHASVISLTESV